MLNTMLFSGNSFVDWLSEVNIGMNTEVGNVARNNCENTCKSESASAICRSRIRMEMEAISPAFECLFSQASKLLKMFFLLCQDIQCSESSDPD